MKIQIFKQMAASIARVVKIELLYHDDYHSDQNLDYLDHATPSLSVTWPDWALPLTAAVQN